MNKLSRWIAILGLVFCTLITVHILDLKSKDGYLTMKGYDVAGVMFNNDLNLNYEKLNEILDVAKRNHVVLMKIIETKTNVDAYLSTGVGEETIAFLSNSKDVDRIKDSCKNNSNCYITTKENRDKNVYAYIKDFLSNNNYQYYSINQLIENQKYIFGSYTVYYKSYDDYEKFINECSTILETNREGLELPFYQVSKSATNYFILILAVIFLLQLVFHFIFQVFSMYNQSKKISILKLQGRNDYHIFKKMCQIEAKYLLFFSVLMLLLCLFLPNITIQYLLFILLFHIVYILFTMLSCYCSVKLITMKHNIIDLLKNKVITSSIVVVSYVFKGVITIVMSVLLCVEIVNLSNYMHLKNIEDNYQYMEKYSYFPKINVENEDFSNYDKFNQLYKELNENGIDCIYADFSGFNYDSSEDQMMRELLDSKQYFLFGSVDINYVKEEKLRLINLDGIQVEISSLPSSEVLLFPKSKEKDIEKFKSFYRKEYQTEYDFSKDTLVDHIYVYEDRQLKTFAPTLDGTGEIDSPILRKIDVNSTKSYFDYMSGLDIAGTGENTALKINSDNQNAYDDVYPFIEKVGLSEALTNNNYYSYQDFFGNKLDFAFSEFSSLLIVVMCILFFYIEIIINTSRIYTEWKVNSIVVKSILGFKKFDVFKNLIFLNFGVDVLCYSVSLIILIALNMTNLLILLCLIYLIIIIVNICLSIILVEKYTKKKKLSILKGERI